MIHQTNNTFGGKIADAYLYRNVTWLSHFHRSFELLIAVEGESRVTVENQEYSLTAGDFVIVFPYQSHSFTVSGERSGLYILVFSGSLIPGFVQTAQNRVPENAKFSVRPFEWEFLTHTLLSVPENDYLFSAALSIVCGESTQSIKFSEKRGHDEAITKLIAYVENGYQKPITLKQAARAIGYSYPYLSRLFSRTMKMNFRDLVNQCRADHAEQLLAEGRSRTEAASESGFGSVRNFNRVEKKRKEDVSGFGRASEYILLPGSEIRCIFRWDRRSHPIG